MRYLEVEELTLLNNWFSEHADCEDGSRLLCRLEAYSCIIVDICSHLHE